MNRISRRSATWVSTALLAGSAFGAAQAPVVIDSEQKAAAAVLAAHHFLIDHNDHRNSRVVLQNITYPPRQVMIGLLGKLASATTPAALRNSGGMDLPCAHGGIVHVQLTQAPVRTLKATWMQCVEEVYYEQVIYNGDGALVLLSDSFTPAAVASLRMGTIDQDFTATTIADYEVVIDTNTVSLNLRMIGLVPMKQPIAGGFITGPFAYETTGFWDVHWSSVFPGSGIPPSEGGYRYSAEHVVTSGYTRLPEDSPTDYLVDDTTFYSGRLTTTLPNAGIGAATTDTIDFDGLRIRTRHFFGLGFTHQVAVEGRARFGWDPSRGAGCLNGAYSFHTVTPTLESVFGLSQFQQGEIVINGSTTTSYAPPAIPDPSQPTRMQGPVSVNVKNVGTYNYVFDSGVHAGLAPIAQCFPD